jgi:glycosyltransferase involved in cell wall biosynthesis
MVYVRLHNAFGAARRVVCGSPPFSLQFSLVLQKVPMTQLDTFVIIPTYNEAENIGALIEHILALPVDVGVIVVDDNSPDGTGAIADEWSVRYPEHVHVIHRAGKLGLGTAYLAGFRKAMDDLDAAKIMTMDADFSHHPRDIPAIVALSEYKHVVIGSRYVPGGATLNWSWYRTRLSQIANLVTHLLLGLEAKDTTAGFRLYHRAVLESIPLDQIFSSGYSFLVEMLFLCQQRGWQIGEVPVIFEDRRFGFTKISQQEIFKAQYTVFRLFFRRLRRREPRRAPISI